MAVPQPLLEPVAFGDIPDWPQDDPSEAFLAFRRSSERAALHPPSAGTLGVTAADLLPAMQAALEIRRPTAAAARAFFEQHFHPFRIRRDDGGDGLVTGYYEPELDASPVRTENFSVPLHARPDDLVAVVEADRPPGLDPSFAFARRTSDGLSSYWDRGAIDSGALDGRGLELAWLENRIDAYFVHVQGSACLRMPDGRRRRIGYAAKTGHPFKGAGRTLIEKGELDAASVTMQSIRAWLAAHPERVDEILWENRSYIFFEDAAIDDPALGPVGAEKVPLTPGRSMAVDRLLHTYGSPIFVRAPTLGAVDASPFGRLMIAQDTGSAIVGAARGDLFIGSGDAAGEVAGVIKHPAAFWLLVPLQAAQDRP